MKKIVVIIILSVTILSGCKKGEEDPAFSIYKRQKRLVGEWTLKQLTVITNIRSNTSDSIFTKTLYDRTYVETEASDSISHTASGTLDVTLEIKDDGLTRSEMKKATSGLIPNIPGLDLSQFGL